MHLLTINQSFLKIIGYYPVLVLTIEISKIITALVINTFLDANLLADYLLNFLLDLGVKFIMSKG